MAYDSLHEPFLQCKIKHNSLPSLIANLKEKDYGVSSGKQSNDAHISDIMQNGAIVGAINTSSYTFFCADVEFFHSLATESADHDRIVMHNSLEDPVLTLKIMDDKRGELINELRRKKYEVRGGKTVEESCIREIRKGNSIVGAINVTHDTLYCDDINFIYAIITQRYNPIVAEGSVAHP